MIVPLCSLEHFYWLIILWKGIRKLIIPLCSIEHFLLVNSFMKGDNKIDCTFLITWTLFMVRPHFLWSAARLHVPHSLNVDESIYLSTIKFKFTQNLLRYIRRRYEFLNILNKLLLRKFTYSTSSILGVWCNTPSFVVMQIGTFLKSKTHLKTRKINLIIFSQW